MCIRMTRRISSVRASFRVVDGAPDQVAAVVEGHQADARGQAGRQGGDPGLDVLDDLVGVLAVAHDDDAADDLPAVDVEGPAAEVAADAHGGDIAQRSGVPLRGSRAMDSRSAALCTRPTPRTMYSAPFSSMVLPPTLRLLAETASMTSPSITPYCFSFRAETSICHWRTKPPMLATSATPGTAAS
jgi:hypothetical protein